MTDLRGRTAVVLLAPLFDDFEAHYPRYRLLEEGVDVQVAGLGAPEYTGKRGTMLATDMTVEQAARRTWDLVVVPGGWAPDKLRTDPHVKQLVKRQHDAGRLLATICHGGWVLASADVVRGHTMTAVRAIHDDLRNAGATVVDREVVVDGNVVSSRVPADLPAFMRETIRLLRAAPVAKVA
jgi:protease I